MYLLDFVIVITFFGISQNPAHPSYAVCVFADVYNYSAISWNFQIATGDSYGAVSMGWCISDSRRC